MKPVTGASIGNGLVAHAERAGAGFGVGDALGAGVTVGQHDAAHPLLAQRVDRDGGDHGGVDAAGQADDDVGEVVLLDVVARAENAGAPVGFEPRGRAGAGADVAGPAVFTATPGRDGDVAFELVRLEGHGAVGVHGEGAAVEDQLVLPAELVGVKHRQPGLDDLPHGDLVAQLELFAREGRAVGNDQDLRAGFGQRLANAEIAPDVLAHRDAEPDAAEGDGAGHGAGVEDALLVEHAVVRQVGLVTDGADLAAFEQGDGVVAAGFLLPRNAHEDARAGRGLDSELFRRLAAGLHEAALQHEVLGRVAGQEELREHDEVRPLPRRVRPAAAGEREVARDVADGGVRLGDRDAEGVHAGRLAGLGAVGKREGVDGPSPLSATVAPSRYARRLLCAAPTPPHSVIPGRRPGDPYDLGESGRRMDHRHGGR